MNRVESQMAELCGLARRMDGLVPDTAALLREVADTLGQLKVENAKLRELVDKLLYGINNELTPADALVWTQEANTMLRKLEVDE